MQRYDYLIIGGGIAGITAAETIREKDQAGTIAVLSREPHLIYSRVLLPHYLKRKVPREKLFLRSADDFTRKRIDIFLGEEVVWVDGRKKEVGLAENKSLGYEKLLISSGGRVKAWGKAKDQNYVYRLQTLEDADRLFASLGYIKNPVIVGGSFIGLEFLEIFVYNQTPPRLISRGERCLERIFNEEGGKILEENFANYGIQMLYQDSISAIEETAEGLKISTQGLRQITADAVAVGIGLDRNIEFLNNSGIELGKKGIRVNEFLETNVEGVFAAGDVAEFYDTLSDKYRTFGNWTNSFLQGKRVGLNMAGFPEPFKNVPSYSITNLGFQITALGDCDEKTAETIVRADRTRKEYERFFLRNGALVGAALINRFQDKSRLAKLIEKRVNLEPYRDKLRDFTFDLESIPL